MKHLTAAALLACAAASAQAASYATTYDSRIGTSTIPQVVSGEDYTITLVFDNGGASAASQTWSASHLTCVIWRMNDAGNVVHAQNMAAAPPYQYQGSIVTNASGAILFFFGSLRGRDAPASATYSSGFAPGAGVADWFIGGLASPPPLVLPNTQQSFHDAAGNGGVPVDPAGWSAPAPYAEPCPAAAPPAPTPPTAVPTLGHAALALLTSLLGAAGFNGRRPRNSTR